MKKRTGLKGGFKSWYTRQRAAYKAKYGRTTPFKRAHYEAIYKSRAASQSKRRETLKLNEEYKKARYYMSEARRMASEGYTPSMVNTVTNLSMKINDDNYRQYASDIEFINEYFMKDEWIKSYYSGAWKNMYETLTKSGVSAGKFWTLVNFLKQVYPEVAPSDLISMTEDMYADFKTKVDYTAEKLLPIWEKYQQGQLEEYIDASEWAPPALPLSMFNTGGNRY